MRARDTHPHLAAPLLLGVALLAGCGGDDEAAPAEPAGGAQVCAEVEAPAPKRVNLKRPDLDPPPAGTVAVVETSCGSFEIALDTERAPRTAASFAFMAGEGVYDRTSFHRIAPGFVIQGGDPAGDGTGDAGYSVDEAPPGRLSYTEGTVAMAKTAAEPPGRSGSQFFVVTAADAGLPTDYALLGKVTEGQDTVSRIEQLGDPATESPSQPVAIKRITLQK